jgi:pre-mRNA-splicing factor SYF1
MGKPVEHISQINPEFPPNNPEWQMINGDFENCLVLCNKYPRIWIMYCTFLLHQKGRITFTRRTFDRALKALPVTQHKDLWEVYIAFAKVAGGDTAIRIWRRFLKIQPSHGILMLT